MQHKSVTKTTGLRFGLLLALVAVLALGVLSAGAAPFGGMAADGAAAGRPATGSVQSYVVLMEGLPLVAYDGSVEGFAATAPAKGEKLDSASREAAGYRDYLKGQQMAALRGAGLQASAMKNSYTNAANGFSALMTAEQAEAMARQPGVVRVMRDQWRVRMTDASPGFLGLDGPDEAWDMGYDGEGVVVGVIDDGIWPEHPSFADDGSFPAPPVTIGNTPDFKGCDFGNVAHNVNDAPFACNDKLIGARQTLNTYRALIGADPDEFDSARDDNGHGTHTASTAAGNMDVMAAMLGIDRGMISGIAPRAHVVAYKGLGNLGGFSSDLAAAIDQAVEDGVDVINYSIGGGPSLTGIDDISFLFAAAADVFVATSAGNSGPGPETVGGPGTVPWITTVGANTQERSFQGTATLGNGMAYTGVSVTEGVEEAPLVDAAVAGGDLCIPGTLDEDLVKDAIVLCRRGAIARVDKSLAVYEAGGVGMIMYENSDAGDLMSDPHWVPSVHMDNTPGLKVKAYIAGQMYANNIYFPAVRGGNGTAGTPNPAVGPATAMITGEQLGTNPTAPSMTSFSSRGPNPVAPDIIKPDITGPGIQILAGWSPFPDPGEVTGELYAAIAGTSMSSPHMAGLFALVKQAHPDWSAAAAKSAVMTTAYQDVVDNDRVTQAGPFAMGAGHMNPGKPGDEGSMFNPGLVYDAGLFDYAAFLCSADRAGLPSANPDALCANLESAGYSLDESDLNLPSIGIAELAGSQTIERYVTSVAADERTYTVSVDAPAGYTVTVSPDEITIPAGDTQKFEVTITNVDAPVGEWRTGSLTWSDGTTDVYSPIAVKGATIGVPSEVSGAGVDSSASFDVNFGYSGAYTAAAHGLEPAVIISDTVVQDPDQDFDPEDGFSTMHEVELSGAAFFRIVMTQDMVGNPDADLDIFVFNPAGEEVASSTSGGTDEQIDLVLPEDGTWTIYVHGWQTAIPEDEELPYDMYTWTISATPGGNMTVDSQPEDAVLATTETIDVSWMGATAGEWHLGAVSHADGDGLIGLTLINVDNR